MSPQHAISLIALLKGIVYDHQKDAWESLLYYENDVKKYFATIGLEVYIDKSEGYAYLLQKETDEDNALPRLAEKRQLNFFTSLLCIVLRKYLLEHDAQGGTVRAIITQQEIINRTKLFLTTISDEARQQERIITTINKVVDIGFLRRLDDQNDNYEIHRIIKGFVNADVIDDTLGRLQAYAAEKTITE